MGVGGVLIVMHVRSRMTIDRPLHAYYAGIDRARGVFHCHDVRSRMSIDRPLHAYNAGTEHVGFSLTRPTLLAPSAKRREVLGESHER